MCVCVFPQIDWLFPLEVGGNRTPLLYRFEFEALFRRDGQECPCPGPECTLVERIPVSRAQVASRFRAAVSLILLC